MNNKYSNISIIFLIAFVVFSCEKNSNLEVPHYNPKLVLHSFISPADSIILVHVSTTKNIFGQRLKDYPNSLPIKVVIIDSDKVIQLSESDSKGYCSVKYQIMPGKEYQIKASCEGYPDISGVCKVPELKNISISIDTFSKTYKQQYGYEYDLREYRQPMAKVKFKDYPSEKNYYCIQSSELIYTETDTMMFPVSLTNDDPNIYDMKLFSLISDNLIDGESISQIFNYSDYYIKDSKSIFLNTTILETDAAYYQYHNSLINYEGGDDPFTEFSPVFSNINGGFGIFASYVKYQKTFKIK